MNKNTTLILQDLTNNLNLLLSYIFEKQPDNIDAAHKIFSWLLLYKDSIVLDNNQLLSILLQGKNLRYGEYKKKYLNTDLKVLPSFILYLQKAKYLSVELCELMNKHGFFDCSGFEPGVYISFYDTLAIISQIDDLQFIEPLLKIISEKSHYDIEIIKDFYIKNKPMRASILLVLGDGSRSTFVFDDYNNKYRGFTALCMDLFRKELNAPDLFLILIEVFLQAGANPNDADNDLVGLIFRDKSTVLHYVFNKYQENTDRKHFDILQKVIHILVRYKADLSIAPYDNESYFERFLKACKQHNDFKLTSVLDNCTQIILKFVDFHHRFVGSPSICN